MTWTIPDQGEAANDLQSVAFQSSLDALAAGDALTGVVSGCAVTAQGSPDMTVAVAAGVVSVLGVPATVASGNVTIGTADGTNPRLDLIVANASGTKSVIAGVAAAAPKEATLDTSTYVLLAQVYIPAAATTITTARIYDRRVIVPGSGMGLATYGDGSDGTVTFDGTTTILGIAPSGSAYLLTRDIYLAAGTINSGVKINTNNYRVFCAGALTNNGTIHTNGTDAVGAAAGSVSTGFGTQGQRGAAGGNGTTGAGSAGTNASSTLGGAGGAGGLGSGGAGGAGGTASAPSVAAGTAHALPVALAPGGTFTAGAGGGGGGGDATNTGGGGGGGGSITVVVARTVTGTGSIQARGGAGATRVTGNVGGGGGGGGGWVVVISSSVASGAITGQTIDANGGTKGNGVGTGANGVNGSSGNVYLIPN